MKSYLKGRKPNYDKVPFVEVKGFENDCVTGWEDICTRINDEIEQLNKDNCVIAVEFYPCVNEDEIITALKKSLKVNQFQNAEEAMKSEAEIDELTYQDVTDDDIFGFLTRLNLDEFYDAEKLRALKTELDSNSGVTIVYGTGAALVAPECDLLIYADMPRWEGQLRQRRNEVSNMGVNNKELKASLQYKRSFFVDWRVCDRLKRTLLNKMDLVLDTVIPNQPKMVSGDAIRSGLKESTNRPFRVVPFFDPGPWGGQWMKEVCDLDKEPENYAWCFDCVPEENSLNLKFGESLFELPSINLVFQHPRELLGDAVHGRFGDEFPIRFDFLDTMQGGNLSLQVHPLTEYIQQKFGIPYTQDESYYMLEAEDDAVVYLGLKNGANPDEVIKDLKHAQDTGEEFDAEKHIGVWPVKKHDHVLIPAGTIHCSGSNSMVLEISATPYIFTFKLYDWGRMGMDGKPRPINIEHGKKVIQWERDEDWTRNNIVDQVEAIANGDGWREERTGLHNREFIETRRHWFTKKVMHNTDAGVNVLNLIEGAEAIVESPTNAFEPYVVHYAETIIVPANVGEYTIRPFGESEGKEIATLKAYVRNNC